MRTKAEQAELNNQYKEQKPIGVYPLSNWGGVEILGIEYGIDDYAVCRYNFGEPEEKVHKLKITYGDGSPYIRLEGMRIRLDECLKV